MQSLNEDLAKFPGRRLAPVIVKEETIWAAVWVLRSWIEKYGVPRALSTDWKNVYIRAVSSAEQLRGEVPVTQFGRMCQKLGIRIIAASSAQAKGRVERNHGAHQDRLIKWAAKASPAMQVPTSTWNTNTCQHTIGVLLGRRPSRGAGKGRNGTADSAGEFENCPNEWSIPESEISGKLHSLGFSNGINI